VSDVPSSRVSTTILRNLLLSSLSEEQELNKIEIKDMKKNILIEFFMIAGY
jgi:hypothetical protein